MVLDSPPPWGVVIDDSESTLVVGDLEPGGTAERAGFKAGWRLLELNGTSIADFNHLKALIAENQPKESNGKYPPVHFTLQVRVWGKVCCRCGPP